MVETVSRPSSRGGAQTERGAMLRMDNPKYVQLLRLLADILCMPRWQEQKEITPSQRDASRPPEEMR
jgi:hypothetical protein